MTLEQRAVLAWPALLLSARHGRMVHYWEIADAIAHSRAGISHVLERIQSFCIIEDLPPLTSIVVTNDGIPSQPGYIVRNTIPQDQFLTFQFDWLARRPMPTDVDFVKVRELTGESSGDNPEAFVERAIAARRDWDDYKATRDA